MPVHNFKCTLSVIILSTIKLTPLIANWQDMVNVVRVLTFGPCGNGGCSGGCSSCCCGGGSCCGCCSGSCSGKSLSFAVHVSRLSLA